MIRTLTALITVAFTLATSAALAGSVGKPAPDFTLKDVRGKSVSLSDYKGKYVVLEWMNPLCPFTRKHYVSNNMQSLQKALTAEGAVWLSIYSTVPGHFVFLTAKQLQSWETAVEAAPTALLLDGDGKVGHLYGAKTTPHMYLISPEGKLIYAGAIDDKPSTEPADIATAQNYLKLALSEAKAGKALTHPSTNPYGCTVKYYPEKLDAKYPGKFDVTEYLKKFYPGKFGIEK